MIGGGTAIRMREVGKVYRLYSSPIERIREVIQRRPRHVEHWALRDVSLDIAAGETFGLVGENGAGKSTFLKLVAKTMRPSTGALDVSGRVAALLELGAGFHPDESGRENALLMAAINGVSGRRMDAYLREVIAFSELPEDVIARPVKTYSSGMFMRLAFAAATAVDPDVLVIDEALSVGDMHFQKKSLDRIMGFRERGKTVLFCSHNLYQIRSLCNRAVWIHQGRIEALGDAEQVVTAYESYERAKEKSAPPPAPVPAASEVSGAPPAYPEPEVPQAPRMGLPVRLRDVTLETPDGLNPGTILTFQPLRIVFDIECADPSVLFHVGFSIMRNDRENVFGSATHFEDAAHPMSGVGPHRVAVRIPELPLLSGDFMVSVYLLDDTGLQVLDMAEGIRPFRVISSKREFGFVFLPHSWERVA